MVGEEARAQGARADPDIKITRRNNIPEQIVYNFKIIKIKINQLELKTLE